jgi:hypothetical protein
LYFNTTDGVMKIYTASGWIAASSASVATMNKFKFTATASQTSFTGADDDGNTLSITVGAEIVTLNGIVLEAGTDYTPASGSITLATGAAASDELNVFAFGNFQVADTVSKSLGGTFAGPVTFSDAVVFSSTVTGIDALPSQSGNSGKYLTTDGSTASWDTITAPTPAAVSDAANSSTGYFALPAGTTAQRPGTPAAGYTRMNTTTNEPEWYDSVNATWVRFSGNTYGIEYLMVAGGGGGGGDLAGGGGAGGYIASAQAVTIGATFAVVIGAGGAGGPATRTNPGGVNGSNTTGFGNTAVGGGTSAGYRNNASSTGSSGGSGGGGSAVDSSSYTGAAGAGTTGQGNAGGLGGYASYYGAGGGGGAGAAGGSAVGSVTGADGGAGKQWLDGSYYAGGGGGGGYSNVTSTQSSGGIGGGGAGGIGAGTAVAGTANTGGGGGGGGYSGGAIAGAAGGSGTVIVRYLGAQRGTGGTVTSSGGYTYHTFTSSGTFTA